MKNIVKSLCIFMFMLVVLSTTYSWKNPSNPPLGNTSAPGETSCQRSGCHGGGSFNGTVKILGIPDTIFAGRSYTVTYEFSTNASRVGYQSVVLDSSKANCGTFTAGLLTSKASQNSRTYIRQSSAKNVPAIIAPKTVEVVSWTNTWVAPPSIKGDSVYFYYNFLAGNGDGGDNGDNAIVGKKAFKYSVTVATTNISFSEIATVYPSPAREVVQIKMNNNSGKYNVELFDINGKLLLKDNVTDSKSLDVKNLARGIVILKLSNDKTSASTKIILE